MKKGIALKDTETRDELSTTGNLKVMSRCLSAPDATSLPPEPSLMLCYRALDTKRPVARLAKGDLVGMCYLLSIQQV